MSKSDWEDKTYPDLPTEAREWLCSHRDLVRRFLDWQRREEKRPEPRQASAADTEKTKAA